jgi:hypothetical protein
MNNKESQKVRRRKEVLQFKFTYGIAFFLLDASSNTNK